MKLKNSIFIWVTFAGVLPLAILGIGVTTYSENIYQKEYHQLDNDRDNFAYHLVLSEPLPEDNWTGLKGFIHQVVLDEYLKNHEEPEEIEYYLCGPPIMIDCVQKMLDSLGVPEEMIAFDSVTKDPAKAG